MTREDIASLRRRMDTLGERLASLVEDVEDTLGELDAIRADVASADLLGTSVPTHSPAEGVPASITPEHARAHQVPLPTTEPL